MIQATTSGSRPFIKVRRFGAATTTTRYASPSSSRRVWREGMNYVDGTRTDSEDQSGWGRDRGNHFPRHRLRLSPTFELGGARRSHPASIQYSERRDEVPSRSRILSWSHRLRLRRLGSHLRLTSGAYCRVGSCAGRPCGEWDDPRHLAQVHPPLGRVPDAAMLEYVQVDGFNVGILQYDLLRGDFD